MRDPNPALYAFTASRLHLVRCACGATLSARSAPTLTDALMEHELYMRTTPSGPGCWVTDMAAASDIKAAKALLR